MYIYFSCISYAFINSIVTMAGDLVIFSVFCGILVVISANADELNKGYYYSVPDRAFIEGGLSGDEGFQSLQVVGNKTSGPNSSTGNAKLSKQLSATCGSEFSSRTFRLRSPAFPEFYPPDTHCSYIVDSYSPRVCQLEINFLTFDVPCDSDSLVVFGEPICGAQFGIRRFKFTQRRDVIQFHSSSGGRGFDLAVRQVQCFPSLPLPNCGGVYSDPQFRIESPNYPLPPLPNSHCVYTVQASSSRICDLEIFFEEFNVALSPDCTDARLEIGDRQPVCGYVTGSVRYRDFLGELRIKFITGNVPSEGGFRILVTQVPCGETNPIYPPLPNPIPTYPTFPPINLPVKPIIPPVYPITPVFPPIGPPNPPYPVYPTFPGTPPQCCNVQYGGPRFHVASPNFPHRPLGAVDCIHEIRRQSPSVCRLHLQFRYFWVGDDLGGCRGGWLEVDGRRFCGCKSGLEMRLGFEYWEATKVFRYRTGPGVGKDSLQGYVIEITQEDCFGGYSRKVDSPGNVTVDGNYRRVRSEGVFSDNGQIPDEGHQGASLVYPSNQTIGSSEAHVQSDVFLYTSDENEEHDRQDPADKLPVGENAIEQSSPTPAGSTKIGDQSRAEDRMPSEGNVLAGGPLLSLTPPLYPAVDFTSSLSTFASLSSPNSIQDSNAKISAALSTYPDAIPSDFHPSPQIELSSLPQPDLSSLFTLGVFDKGGRKSQSSCFAAGFTQWLSLAKQFLWTGLALCPVRPPVRPPVLPPIRPPPGGCVVFDQPRGIVLSPGYPRGYPPNLKWCFSFHRVPGFCILELTFDDFAFENSKHCHKDYLLVGGARRCGTSLRGATLRFDMSRINFAKMLMVSDNWGSGRGFRARYRQLPCRQTPQPPAPICSRYFTEAEFELRLDGAHPRECVFVVAKFAPEITQLQISFVDFNLVCGQEYVVIGNDQFCGLQTGRTVNVDFPSSEIRIVYSTGGQGRGFHLYVRQVKGLFLNVTPARLQAEKTSALQDGENQ